MTARERVLPGSVMDRSCGSSRCSRQQSTDAFAAFRRQALPPPVPVERPAGLDRELRQRPVAVAQEADPSDQRPARGVDGRPVTEAVSFPSLLEPRDLGARALEVERRHVLEELRLRVDLREGLGVVVSPPAQEQSLRAQLLRDHDFASFQSSPMPTSTASAGSSG
jgi:hypothetical protein